MVFYGKLRFVLSATLMLVPYVVTGVVDFYDTAWFGFKLGYEALLINGALMVVFLLLSSLKTPFNRLN